MLTKIKLPSEKDVKRMLLRNRNFLYDGENDKKVILRLLEDKDIIGAMEYLDSSVSKGRLSLNK